MELVGTARRNDPVGHRRGSRCALPRAREANAAAKQRELAEEFLFGDAHSRIMPGKE